MMKIFQQKAAKDARKMQFGWLKFFPLRSSGPSVKLLLFFFLTAIPLKAEVAPAEMRIPKAEAWTGQKLSVYIDLNSKGSFSGAASFALPEIPGSVLLKIGGALISSKEIAGETWAVQTHEFALFSQRSGSVDIPAIQARFGAREGFTGPVSDIEATVDAARVEIRRPPGTEDIPFLITTESLEITETWEPTPEDAKVGDVFKRTIIRRAEQMAGMTLVPAPTQGPDGFRIYPPKVETSDKTERGQFLGERRETITYQITDSGTMTLPEIRYVWWDLQTETLGSKILPAISINVAALPRTASEAIFKKKIPWLLTGFIIFLGVIIWQKSRLFALYSRLNPPHKTASRKFLRACCANDATAAESAWNAASAGVPLSPDLSRELLDLRRHRFAAESPPPWNGSALANAFSQATKLSRKSKTTTSTLPALNP